jgi:hypothetical protein
VGGLCELRTQCLEDSECHGYRTCLVEKCNSLGAPDPECRMICGSIYPTGARTFYQSVGTRFFNACTPECGAGRHWECQQPAVWPGVSGETALVTINGSPGEAGGFRE